MIGYKVSLVCDAVGVEYSYDTDNSIFYKREIVDGLSEIDEVLESSLPDYIVKAFNVLLKAE